jgi:hypothetical protein
MRLWRSGSASRSKEAVPAGATGACPAPGEDIGQPSLRVDVVHLGRDDQGIHKGGAVSAARGSGEEPGLAAVGDAAGSPFGRIARQANTAVIEGGGGPWHQWGSESRLDGEGFPAAVFLEHVGDGLGDGVVLRHPGALNPHPILEVTDHRVHQPLTGVMAGLGGQAGDPTFNIEDGVEAFDRVQRYGSRCTQAPMLMPLLVRPIDFQIHAGYRVVSKASLFI